MDAAVIGARLVQYLAAAVLFGTSVFQIYGARGPAPAWLRLGLAVSAAALAAGAVVALCAQTAVMADDPRAAFDTHILRGVLSDSAFGMAILVRGCAAGMALTLLALGPSPRPWLASALLGGVALGSFVWSGHGAANEGWAGVLHVAADLLHLLAAGVWLGALVALAAQAATVRPGDQDGAWALQRSLAGFAGVGSAAVAAILVTGLVNSAFLVGLSGLRSMGTSPYGRLLLIKLVLFAAMLGLAALNRYRLTPRLAAGLQVHDPGGAMGLLRRSLLLETALGAGVLALVATLGVLEPVAAS